jgi:hypothetical protein
MTTDPAAIASDWVQAGPGSTTVDDSVVVGLSTVTPGANALIRFGS